MITLEALQQAITERVERYNQTDFPVTAQGANDRFVMPKSYFGGGY